MPFGYGDGGGGPTREMLETAHRVADLEGSPRVTVRAPAEFFAEAQAEYPDAPVWSGEMYLEFHRGTYTSQSAMKRGNRRTEHLLREAELWAATAALRTGFAYPYAELDAIWQQALLMQFHDILPGSSIAWVHRQARETYAGLADRLEAIIGAALAALAGDGEAELIANAAPHARAGVPALGLGPARDDAPRPVTVDERGDGTVLENGLLRVTVAPDGTLAGVYDLVADREVLAGAGNMLQLHPDTPNRFDAWDLDEFYRHRRRDLTDAVKVEVERGPAALVRVTRHDGASTYVQTISLAPGRRVVEFALDVDWHERETVLKVAFPIDVHAERSTSEIQFGHVHRPTHTNTSWDAAKFEICAHRWLHVAEPGYGAALVNDGTYGHDVTRRPPGDGLGAPATTARLTLLRAPLYPDPQTDQGRHRFGYSLVCGAEVADAVREGYRANLPVRRVAGRGPVAPLIEVSDPAVVVESVKLADDRSGDVVVRLYESLGGRTRTAVTASFPVERATVTDLLEREDPEIAALAPAVVDGSSVDLGVKPFQVVTLRLRPSR
jgi:alpha-mannosidase